MRNFYQMRNELIDKFKRRDAQNREYKLVKEKSNLEEKTTLETLMRKQGGRKVKKDE